MLDCQNNISFATVRIPNLDIYNGFWGEEYIFRFDFMILFHLLGIVPAERTQHWGILKRSQCVSFLFIPDVITYCVKCSWKEQRTIDTKMFVLSTSSYAASFIFFFFFFWNLVCEISRLILLFYNTNERFVVDILSVKHCLKQFCALYSTLSTFIDLGMMLEVLLGYVYITFAIKHLEMARNKTWISLQSPHFSYCSTLRKLRNEKRGLCFFETFSFKQQRKNEFNYIIISIIVHLCT